MYHKMWTGLLNGPLAVTILGKDQGRLNSNFRKNPPTGNEIKIWNFFSFFTTFLKGLHTEVKYFNSCDSTIKIRTSEIQTLFPTCIPKIRYHFDGLTSANNKPVLREIFI